MKQNLENFSKVNIKENYEFKYWMNRLGLNEQTLREVVSKVGNSIKTIEEYLVNMNKSRPCH